MASANEPFPPRSTAPLLLLLYNYYIHTYIHTYTLNTMKALKRPMGRVVKTISLDKITAELAENIPNFSAWVREQIMIEHVLQGGDKIHTRPPELRGYSLKVPNPHIPGQARSYRYVKLDLCNPHHKDGICSTCWPPTKTLAQHKIDLIRHHMGEEE